MAGEVCLDQKAIEIRAISKSVTVRNYHTQYGHIFFWPKIAKKTPQKLKFVFLMPAAEEKLVTQPAQNSTISPTYFIGYRAM